MPQPGARRGLGSRGHELVISHTFAAPRSRVFDAWTRADDVSRWLTPRPLTTSRCEVDFRPGGVFRLTMRATDGTEYPLDARFGEIVAPERLVFTGNIHDEAGQSTYCHACSSRLIGRDWYTITGWGLNVDGSCASCGEPCSGLFEPAPGKWGARRAPIVIAAA